MARGGGDDRLPLLGGAYEARSVIANAQRCVNLYPEINPAANDPPTPVTHYLTPGLTTLVTPGGVGCVRGLYRATLGQLYAVVNDSIFFIDNTFTAHLIGGLVAGTTPVTMFDNGIIVVLVDGTAAGYWWALGSLVLNVIADPAFYGADWVDYLDGFFIFNRPGTNQFYISPNFWDGTTPFDGLDIASKIGGPDPIIGLAVIHRELWLIGQLTSEVWYNTGGQDFPFERMPGVFVDHGMLRGHSLAKADESLFWLGRNRQGQCIVFQGTNYVATRISTHAIEQDFQTYAVVNDAVAFTYQQDGHTFYVLTFPSADKTWVYDLATQQWHERVWTDGSGVEHRIRPNCAAAAFNVVVVGDWQNGKIYQYDLAAFTDAGDPIVRRRGFPHVVKNGKRFSHDAVILDMEVGTPLAVTGAGPDVMLRWSDTRGATWGDTVPINMGFGATGQYDRSLILRNLGLARDRVYEVYWSFPYQTALQGMWLQLTPAET